jgi:hypothetical protein
MIKHAGAQGLYLGSAGIRRSRRASAARRQLRNEETAMTKIILAAALAIAAMSAVPAFVGPHGTQVACTEDLGYGRTGSYGC